MKTKENLATVWKLLAEDNDPMNKRILECIDQKLDYNTEVTDKEGILLLFDLFFRIWLCQKMEESHRNQKNWSLIKFFFTIFCSFKLI